MKAKKVLNKILVVSICLLFVFSVFQVSIGTGENSDEDGIEKESTLDNERKEKIKDQGSSTYEPLQGKPSYQSKENELFKNGEMSDNALEAFNTKKYHNLDDAWQEYDGTGTNIGLVDSGVDFANPELHEKYAVVEDEDSPYYGWPIAFDPLSMNKLLKEKDVSKTWYVDTSRTGGGPFNYSHGIKVDGDNDFAPSDEVANPGLDDKDYWDLKDLHSSRDEKNWYFGFSTNVPSSKYTANSTNILFIDSDGGESGGLYSPKEKMAEFNTSHKDTVTGVAYSPSNDLVASCGLDKKVKIWDATTGKLDIELTGHGEAPLSLVWTEGGDLVTVDKYTAIIWDVSTGDKIETIDYYQTEEDPAEEPYISILDFHKNSTGAQEEWLAVAGGKMVHIYDSNWNRLGTIYTKRVIRSVRFNPNGTYIATGLSNGDVNIYNWTALDSSDPGSISTSPDPQHQFGIGSTINTISWKADGNKIAAGSSDKIASIWSIPKVEQGNTANATEKVLMGSKVDESDDDISDLENSKPTTKSPVNSIDGDGWYTLESDENLCVSNFDIGTTGGKLLEAYVDIRYDVNDEEGDASQWSKKYIQIQTPRDGWKTLNALPDASDNNVTFTEDILSYFDYVEELQDAAISYNFDYTGPTPGPSISFDYINIRYSYVPGRIYKNHSSPVSYVDWSPDESTVLSSEGGDVSNKIAPGVHLWNPVNGETTVEKELYQPLYSTNWRDSDNFVSGSRDLSVREWNANLKETAVFRQNLPNYAIAVNLTSRWDDREDGHVRVGGRPEFYRWDGEGWENPKFSDIKGTYSLGEDSSFIEFSIPREEIAGDPLSIGMQMVSFGRGENKIELGEREDTSVSHAQDSVPEDKNVFERSFQYGTIDEDDVPDIHLAHNTLFSWKTDDSQNEAEAEAGDLKLDPISSSPHLPQEDDGWFTATGGKNISLEENSDIPSISSSTLIKDVSLNMRYSVNALGSESMGPDTLKYFVDSEEYDTGISFSTGDTDNTVTIDLENVNSIKHLDSLVLFYNHSGSATLNIDYIKVSYDFYHKATSLSAFAAVDIPQYTVNLNDKASVSGDYHFGMHPSERLSKKIGQPGLLVIDSEEPHDYDTVLIDIDMDYVFTDDDIALTKNKPIDYIDNFNATVPKDDVNNITTPDGFPDISSGLLYYISKATKTVSDPLSLDDFDRYNETYIEGDNISTFPKTLNVYKEGNSWDDEYIYRTLTFEKKISTLDIDGNIHDGTLRISGSNLKVDNKTVYQASGKDKEFFLPHNNLHDITLYYNGTMDDWIELPILTQTQDVDDWSREKYDDIYCSVNMKNGLVDFNPAFRLYPDDNIYASYNWSGELEDGVDYSADIDDGKISFTEGIYNYSKITIEYTFDYWSVNFDEDEEKYKLELTDVVYGNKLEEDEELVLHYSEEALPVPGSEEQADVLGVDNVIPGNGDMICLMGDFKEEVDVLEQPGQHGTAMASVLAGSGFGYENAQRLNDIVDYMNNVTIHNNSYTGDYKKLNIPNIEGVAPGAKIIPVGNAYSDLYSSWNFLAKGYDGIVGTEDEAHIISNPYNIEDEQLAGWDDYSRRAEVAMLLDGKSEKLFIGSAGDQGPGYGSILPPGGAPHMLTVGYANIQSGDTEGPNPVGPVAISRYSKGPTAMGHPKPEVVALGKYNVSLPLHGGYKGVGSNGVSTNVYPNKPWDGVDVSSAIVTGIAALAHQASNSGFNLSEGRSILMGAANDTGANVLRQGAGFLDAKLATDIASGTSGFKVKESTWVPGDFNGKNIEGFTKTVKPGDSIEKEFKVDYYGGSDPTTVSQGTYEKMQSYQFEDETFSYSYMDMLGRTHSMYKTATGFVINESGMFQLNSEPEDQMMIKDEVEHYQKDPGYGMEMGVQAYPTSEKVTDFNLSEEPDMVRIRAHSPYSEIYDKGGTLENDFYMAAYNWENRMGDYLDYLKTTNAPAIDGAQKFPEMPWISKNTNISEVTAVTVNKANPTHRFVYLGDSREDGEKRLEILDIQDLSPTAPNFAFRGRTQINGDLNELEYMTINGFEYIAAASGDEGLVIVNVTDKDNPLIEGSYDTAGYSHGLGFTGTNVYLGDGDDGVKIIDVSNPSNPALISTIDTNSTAMDVAVDGNYVYISQLDRGVLVYDISTPASPAYVSEYNYGGLFDITDARSSFVDSGYLHVADGEGGFKILDISTPSSPSSVGNVSTPGTAMKCYMMPSVEPNNVYLSDGDGGFHIVDVSTKADPQIDWSHSETDVSQDVVAGAFWISDYSNYLPLILTADRLSGFHSYLPEAAGGPSFNGIISTAISKAYSYSTSTYPLNHSINSPLWTSGIYGNVPECNFPTLTRNDESYPLRTFNLSKYEPYINQSEPNFDYLYETDGTEILYELNTIDFDYSSNSLSVMVDDLDSISQNGGLFINLGRLTDDTENTNWTFDVEFFKEKPHDWISVDNSVSISGDSGTFTAALDVPEDAKPGSYEASIKLKTGTQLTTIPVLINVMSERMMAEFGGSTDDRYLYSNDFVSGVAGDPDNSGDWRYYPINVPDQGRYKQGDEELKMITEVDWSTRENIYTTIGSGDVSTDNIHGTPDNVYAEFAPGEEVELRGLDVSGLDSMVNNVKIMVKHRYEGTVPDVDANNLTVKHSIGGSKLNVNVTEETTISELDITWDSHEHGAPKWNWAEVGGMTLYIKHNISGLPGDGKLLIDSVWLEVETKNVVEVKDDVSILTSDLDVKVLQPTKDFATNKGEGVFGKGVSVSKESIGVTGETNTNTTRTLFGTPVVAGLNVIAVRNTRVDGGCEPGERLSGRVFPFEIKPSPGDVNTNERLSTHGFQFVGGMGIDRFNASAIGPAQSETIENLPIPQDDVFGIATADDFYNALGPGAGYRKYITIENALSIEISTWDMGGAPDVDIALWKDDDGDGEPDFPNEMVEYSGFMGSDEHIKVMNPEDGEYILTILGYETSDPGYIGLKISIVLAGVEGYELENVPRQPLDAFEKGEFDLKWNFPGDAKDSAYGGVINVGIDGTLESFNIPLNIFLDTRAPEIKDTSPEPNEITSDSMPPILARYTDTIKERTYEKQRVYVGGLKLGNSTEDDWITKEEKVVKEIGGTGVDTSNIWIRLDDVNITTYSTIREDGTMSYIPDESMDDGIHYVSVKAKDRAGNMRVHNWSFEIDTTLPEISLSGDLTRGMDDILFTNEDVLPLSGSLSEDTETLELSVSNDTGTMTKQIEVVDSSFDDEITLDDDGMYELTFKATDRVDNSMEEVIMVYKDTVEPDIKINSPLPTEDVSNKDMLTLKGEIDRKEEFGDVKVYVDGVEVKVMADGYFDYTVNMEEGENEFEITAVDEAGNTGSTTRAMERDTTSPTIDWDYELDGDEITITGSVNEDADVMINGKPIAVSGDGFSSTISLRKRSMNEVIITAEDEAGNVAQSTKSIDLTKEEEEGMSGSMMGAIIAGIIIALLAGLLLGFKVLPMFLGKEEEEEVIEEEVEEEVPIEEEEVITDEEGEELEEDLFGEEEEEVSEDDIFGEPEEGEELEEDFEEETVEEEVIDEELEEGEIEPEPEAETEEEALEEPGGTEETIEEEAMDEELEESEESVEDELDEEKTDELE
ncbi:MAG: Ig-like domain-containing protein [Thermoplasmata archaeon]